MHELLAFRSSLKKQKQVIRNIATIKKKVHGSEN